MPTLFLSLFLAAILAATAANPETLGERSHERASEVLDAAVAAIGGAEALRDVRAVRLQLQGETWTRLQMPTPDPPFEPGRFEETLTVDLAGNRLLLEQRNRGAGFEGHNAVVISGGEGTNYDLRARTATPIPAAQTTGQQFVQYYRRLPNLLLLQALNRTNSLRYLGEDTFEGQKQNVITFVMPDTQQVALYVDAKTNLISKYELSFTDPLAGDDVSEIIFSDYVQAGKLKVPQTWSWRLAGDLQARYKARAEFNPPLSAATFQIAGDFTRVDAPPATPEPRVETLADGVHVLHNIAGPNQNSFAVEFEDHLLVVEAPGTSDGSDRVIARLKELAPSKPIRYLAMTHHHGDHIGGLRSFIAEGATVVTTRKNGSVVERMASAPQRDRLFRQPRKPELMLVEGGKRVFSDGRRTVEVIDIGPNPHAREMLIAYLPKERVLFQGDLFFLPQNDAPQGPPQASTLAFARELRKRRLTVERIASVHGATATIEQFDRVVGQ